MSTVHGDTTYSLAGDILVLGFVICLIGWVVIRYFHNKRLR